jgi:hypothetical protein
VGDFNGDGIPDVVVANHSSNTVSVLLGNRDGTFQPARSYDVGATVSSVAVADFNGDGIPDLAVASYTYPPGTVSILLGKGDGTFRADHSFAAGNYPTFVAVGDFNGDGIPDLALVNQTYDLSVPGTVSILLGNGDGTFQAAQNYGAGIRPASVAVGDFNGDGILDLAVANRGIYPDFANSSVSILLGNGDGTFQTAQSYAIGYAPTSVAVADFNGDGIPDLALATHLGATILLGNGGGTFQALVSYPAGSDPSSVVVADFNGDGIADLAVANSTADTISIFFGKDEGTFQAAQSFAVGNTPMSVAAGNFNADGILDLAVANSGEATVSVLLGNGDGTFQPAQNYVVGSAPRSVAVADFNRDGIPDLAVANDHDGTVSILLGNGDGTFQAAQSYAAGDDPFFLAVGDFNGDGAPDLALADRGDTVSVLLGNGDGTFQAARSFSPAMDIISLVVADLNGDGKDDIVTTSFVFDIRPPSSLTTIGGYLSNGDGTFREAKPYTITNEGWPGAVVVRDLNGDGIPDLALAYDEYSNDAVTVFVGNGDGTFRPSRTYSLKGYVPQSITVADFNQDGKPDLAVTDNSGVNILLGNGDGTFQAAQIYMAGSYPSSLVSGNFNRDGYPDLAVANAIDPGTVTILINRANWP